MLGCGQITENSHGIERTPHDIMQFEDAPQKNLNRLYLIQFEDGPKPES